MIATASLASDKPVFAHLTPVASGVLAAPISQSPGEYIICFRPERVRKVTWAGNPFKPVVVGNDPSTLSPRRSFAQWHQLVEGTSISWAPADLAAARLIGETVADVVPQFRSVRMLIARAQLEQVREQVQLSEQPVIVADPAGRILLTNNAFEHLLRSGHPHLQSLEDLPELFSSPGKVRQVLKDLQDSRRPWRGEFDLEVEIGQMRPLLLRADPVFATPNHMLGFVLLFSDLTERRRAESARSHFQEGIIERHRAMAVRLDSKADLVYRNLLSSVVGNAQLAALEIADREDLGRIPEMLESVRASVTRTAELLEHLIWHASSQHGPSDEDS